MQSHALQIAEKYKVDRETWRTAAQNLRAPYWDWATPGNIVPPAKVISLQFVSITTFDGSTTSVSNPLYQYRFHPIDASFNSSPNGWRYHETTFRGPQPNSPNATMDVQKLTGYVLTLPPSHSHSRFSHKVICYGLKRASPTRSRTFSGKPKLGLRSATGRPIRKVAMPLTLWKLYMTQFTLILVVIWVTRPLLVTLSMPPGFWVTLDLYFLRIRPHLLPPSRKR